MKAETKLKKILAMEDNKKWQKNYLEIMQYGLDVLKS